jgi:hypothetical protein
MPSFNQNVNIKINLEANTGDALTNIGTSLTAIKSSAGDLEDDLKSIETDLKNFGESFDKDQDLQVGGKVDLDSIQDAVTRAKLAANTFTNEIGTSDISIGAEMDIEAEETTQALAEEVAAIEDAIEEGEVWDETKQEITDSNKAMGDEADNSVTELKKEESSFADLIDAGDNLTQIKQKVADANEHVRKMSKESADEMFGESTAAREVAESLGAVEDSADGVGTSTNRASNSLRRLRRRTDSASDSMRAAAEVGDLFEDGLGSLSVNLGAFTVAIRNFLTQVPLLLTALGAAGAAAVGAASGFVALAGALGAVVAAGAVSHAQELKSQYGELEELGESFQVIMLNVKDTLMEAAAPILENEEAIGLFKQAVQGAAFVVNLLANAIASLTDGMDDMDGDGRAEEVFTLSEAFDLIATEMAPALEEVVTALRDSFRILGEEIIKGTARATEGLANMIRFSTWLFDQIEDLSGLISQFGDTLADLAVVGARVGGGLLPVFESFLVIMESVAEAIRSVKSETVENAVTFLALVVAINKVSGVMASLLVILPNVAIGMGNIAASASSASGAIATMRATLAAAGTQLGGFLAQTSLLGGMTQLAAVFGTTGQRVRRIAFSSTLAQQAFDDLADEVEGTADELTELAVRGELAESQLKSLDDVGDDVNVDVGGDQLDADQFLPDDPITSKLFRGTGDAADDAAESASSIFQRIGGGDTIQFGGELREESNKATKAFADNADALGFFRHKLGNLRSGATNTAGSLKDMIPTLSGIRSSVTGTATSIADFASGALLSMQNSLRSVRTAVLNFVFAQNQSRIATLKDIGAKFAGAAANLVLAAAEAVAASGALALAAALAVATGGVLLLLGVIGGLAVGVITHFDQIKSAASGAFGFLKQIIDILIDVLIGYFLASWNLMAEAFNQVMGALRPLISMFMNIGAALGLVGGKGEDTGGIMSTLASTGSFLMGIFGGLATLIDGLIQAFGAVLSVVTTLISIALMPVLIVIELITAAIDAWLGFLDMLVQKFLGVGSVVGGIIGIFEGLFGTIMAGINLIPMAIEGMINTVIGLINTFIGAVNMVPGVSIQKLSKVDLTKEPDVDREQLANDTEEMQEGTKAEGDKTITYNEDNSTNIDQTVNADPEDQAQLSRVVTDAIAEANSFERRRQGGQ